MTTTIHSPSSASTKGYSPPPARDLPKAGRRRRLTLLLLAMSLIAVAALLNAYILKSQSGHAVLAVARPIPIGHTITDNDLSVATISTDPKVKTIAADQRDNFVGKIASTTMRAGMLLTPDSVTDVLTPNAGQQLVALALQQDKIPARGLTPGETVLLIHTPEGQTNLDSVGIKAVVLETTELTAKETQVVDVVVDERQGPQLAAQSAAGQLSLIVLPAGR